MKKRISIVLCSICLAVFGVLGVSAYSTDEYQVSTNVWVDMISYSQTETLADVAGSLVRVSGGFNRYSQTYQSTGAFPLMITATKSSSSDTYLYSIYWSFTSGLAVQNIPEELVSATSVTLNTAVSTSYIFKSTIGWGDVFIKSTNPNYQSGSGNTLSLESREKVIYVYSGVVPGVVDLYPFSSEDSTNVGSLYNWEDALNVFRGITTPPDSGAIQNAYNEGYSYGYDIGRNDGYQLGESAGYAEGQRDGTAEIDIPGVIDSYFEGARTIFEGWFDYTIFGVNIMGLLAGLVVVAIVFFVLKKVK